MTGVSLALKATQPVSAPDAESLMTRAEGMRIQATACAPVPVPPALLLPAAHGTVAGMAGRAWAAPWIVLSEPRLAWRGMME